MSDPESRTLLLDRSTVDMLIAVGRGQKTTVYDELRGALPNGMSQKEIGDVGIQVENVVELEKPSWDGLYRGRRVEESATLAIGAAAIFAGDFITADSARLHLRELGGIGGRIGAFMLGRRLNKAQAH